MKSIDNREVVKFISYEINTVSIRPRVFLLKKLLFLKDKHTNEILFCAATEVGAWMFAAGFFASAYCVGRVIF